MAEATGHYMCLGVSEWLKESRFMGCTFTRTEGFLERPLTWRIPPSPQDCA